MLGEVAVDDSDDAPCLVLVSFNGSGQLHGLEAIGVVPLKVRRLAPVRALAGHLIVEPALQLVLLRHRTVRQAFFLVVRVDEVLDDGS